MSALLFSAALGCQGARDERPPAPDVTMPPAAPPRAPALLTCPSSGATPTLVAGAPFLPGDHRSVFGADERSIYIAGYVAGAGGEILRLDEAGHLTPQSVPVTTALDAVFGAAADDLYAVGEAGVVLHSAGDDNWRALPAPADVDYHGGWAAGSDLFVGGGGPSSGPYATVHGGLLAHSPDGGRTWEQSTIGAQGHPGDSVRPRWVAQLWGAGAGDVYAAAFSHPGLKNTSTLYHYAAGGWAEVPIDDQTPWSPQYPASPGEELWSLWGTAGGALYLGGDGEPFGAGGILRLENGAFQREKIPLTDPTQLSGVPPIRAIWGPSPDLVLAASGSWILLRRSSADPWCIAAVAAGDVAALWGPPGGRWFYAVGKSVQRISIE